MGFLFVLPRFSCVAYAFIFHICRPCGERESFQTRNLGSYKKIKGIPCSGENPKKFFLVRQIGFGQVSGNFRVISTKDFRFFDVNGV